MTVFSYLSRKARTLQLLQFHSTFAGKDILRNENFVPKKVLILSKLSRYQFEKLQKPKLSETELKAVLIGRGSDYDNMLATHLINKNVENQLIQTLKKINAEYRIINRITMQLSDFAWADLVIPIGGDGTFLLAANMIFSNNKPIIGINSNPEKSAGYLLLSSRYTEKIPDIFEALKAGHYSILMRRRIRVTLTGEGIWQAPFHMHEKEQTLYRNKSFDNTEYESEPGVQPKKRRLPWLALNEVYIGEILSARTSTLLIKLDNREKYHKMKGSGLCVSTGTGSSSWYKSINRLNNQTVQDILDLVKVNYQFTDQEIDQICLKYNSSLQYSAEDPKLSYSIRDMLMTDASSLKDLPPRGFCKEMTVKSQCFDAALVFDGGITVPFSYGTIAKMESFSEDSLRTIILPD